MTSFHDMYQTSGEFTSWNSLFRPRLETSHSSFNKHSSNSFSSFLSFVYTHIKWSIFTLIGGSNLLCFYHLEVNKSHVVNQRINIKHQSSFFGINMQVFVKLCNRKTSPGNLPGSAGSELTNPANRVSILPVQWETLFHTTKLLQFNFEWV